MFTLILQQTNLVNMNKSTHFVGQHLFSQIISLASKKSLFYLFNKHQSDRYYKQLKTWEHFIAMMYGTLAGCSSLREIVMGLEASQGKNNHLNISYVPPRSTLSDGNKNRPSDIFGAIYSSLYHQYKPSLSDSSLPDELLKKLFLMDATVFGLFKEILRTSGRNPMDGKRKGGIKKNTLLKADTLMPELIRFTEAAMNDQQFYKHINLPEGSYITFDKEYNNYKQYASFTEKKIWFITRMKENAIYQSIKELDIPEGAPDSLLKDEIITVTYKDENKKEGTLLLRRIAWWVEKEQKCYEFITNNLVLDATVVAAIYKYRWKIELFFKKLKQNFPLGYFVGDNQNAIEIQIWCALIGLLLLSTIHHQNKSKMAFSVMVSVIRQHLMNYIGLTSFLKLHNRKRYRKASNLIELNLFNSS